jgi:hypothetical protein
MLILVTVFALATQVPLAVTLEVDLHAETAGLGPDQHQLGAVVRRAGRPQVVQPPGHPPRRRTSAT